MATFIKKLHVSQQPGTKYDIYLLVEDGQSAIEDFIGKLQSSDFNKLLALLKRYAESGPLTNPEHFKKLAGYKDLHEFKTHGVRVFCHLDGRRVVLLEGCNKRSNKATAQVKNSYERAARRLEIYKRVCNGKELGVVDEQGEYCEEDS